MRGGARVRSRSREVVDAYDRVIALDTGDLVLYGDVAELWAEFDRFSDAQVGQLRCWLRSC